MSSQKALADRKIFKESFPINNVAKLTDRIYVYDRQGNFSKGATAYVVKGSKKTVLIDPGFSPHINELADEMKKDGLDPTKIDLVTNTHLHLDHSDADSAFADTFKSKVELHESMKELTESDIADLDLFRIPKKKFSYFKNDLDLGDVRLKAIETPGHIPGHVAFYVPEEKALISGDLIFDRNVGRVDLPGSDERLERESVEKVSKLDLRFVLPGHGKLLLTKKDVQQNFDYILKRWNKLE